MGGRRQLRWVCHAEISPISGALIACEGCFIMAIGAILQAASFSYAQMIVARIITGIGNGLNVGSV